MTDANDHRLRVLPPAEVNSSWPQIAELLKPAIKFCNGEFEADDLLAMVNEGRAFVMALEQAGVIRLASVCEVLVFPKKKVLNVIAVAGSRLDVALLVFWEKIEDVARTLEVDSIRGAVRPAMQRYYRRIAPEATIAYAILERKI